MTSDVPSEFQSNADIEMSSDPKPGESSKLQLCGEVQSIEINVKPGSFSQVL